MHRAGQPGLLCDITHEVFVNIGSLPAGQGVAFRDTTLCLCGTSSKAHPSYRVDNLGDRRLAAHGNAVADHDLHHGDAFVSATPSE